MSNSNIGSADESVASVSTAKKEIDLLREYRVRLIADVVTGKLDVRDAAAQIPDEIADFIDADDFGDNEAAVDADSDGALAETVG